MKIRVSRHSIESGCYDSQVFDGPIKIERVDRHDGGFTCYVDTGGDPFANIAVSISGHRNWTVIQEDA